MKLPNSKNAIIDLVKLTDYCLSYEHPRGRHKARVFQSSLGLTISNAEELRATLQRHAITEDCTKTRTDQYGTRYLIDFEYQKGRKVAMLRSQWIIKIGETKPRLTTCYVL